MYSWVRKAPNGVLVGLGVLLGIVVAGLWLPLPYDPIQPLGGKILQAPSAEHIFGTDHFGFDVYSRTVAAAARDLPLALAGTVFSMAVGVIVGLYASRKGAGAERLMRALDAFQAFPLLILAIALVTMTGNRLENVVFAIVVIHMPRFTRLVRAEALALRESRFVEAAIAIGASPSRVLWKHVLPNLSGVVLAQASLTMAHALLVIASMNFLGVGVSPPEPSWGSMIQSGAGKMVTGHWWPAFFPGLAVLGSVAALNVVADSLSERWQG